MELAMLVELDRTGNLRRAADALAVSQSTLSAALVRLERRYGASLFERDQRGTRATASGRIVIDAAVESLEALNNARRRVELLNSSERATLAIGADPSLVEAYVVPAIAGLIQDVASLQISVRSASADELLRLLRDQRIEYFLGLRPDAPLDGVDIQTVGSVSTVPFCRIGHPLTRQPPLGIQVLRDYPYVLTRVPRWYQQELRQSLPIGSVALGPGDHFRTIELQDYGAVRSLVRSSDAIGLAPYGAIRTEVEAGTLALLGVPEDQRALVRSRAIVVATLTDRPLPPLAQRSLDVVIAEVGSADDP